MIPAGHGDWNRNNQIHTGRSLPPIWVILAIEACCLLTKALLVPVLAAGGTGDKFISLNLPAGHSVPR